MSAFYIEDVVRALSGVRLPLHDEKALQAEIAARFTALGIDAEREVILAPGDIVDFMVGAIAIEVKIKGSRRDILRQCQRYAGHARVEALVLATNVAMGFPPELNGKPTAVLNLGRAWL